MFEKSDGEGRAKFKEWHFSLADTKDALRTERGQPGTALETSQFLQMDSEGLGPCVEKGHSDYHFLFYPSARLLQISSGDLIWPGRICVEFNQISVVNILVQPYSLILAFVLCRSVVDQSCSALSGNAGLSGLHLTVSGCWCFPFRAAALGAHTGLVGSSNLRAKRRTAFTLHKHTESPPTAARNTQRNTFPSELVNPGTERTFLHPSATVRLQFYVPCVFNRLDVVMVLNCDESFC